MRSQLKSLFARTGLLVSGALLASACAAPAQTGAGSTVTLAAVPTITVVGRGEATAKPDIARINLGVEAAAPTVSAALAQANSQMSAVIAAVKNLGVPDKDIQTSHFSINFERPEQQPGGPPPQAGIYRVSNMVAITLRDPKKAGPALEAAVNAGANSVWSVSFGLDDTKAVEAQARAEAVADARARAEDLARLSGLHLSRVASVSTIIGRESGPIPMRMAKEADAATPIEAGELSWSTEVEVVFEFSSP